MVMDLRGHWVILLSSLSESTYMWNAPRERALQKLKELYGQDFGYDQEKWLNYMLENDTEFVENLQEFYWQFSLEPFIYDALEKDGRFDMSIARLLEHPIEKYDRKGRLKPDQ